MFLFAVAVILIFTIETFDYYTQEFAIYKIPMSFSGSLFGMGCGG